MQTQNLWERARDVFCRARGVPEAERGALLAEACGDDAALRSEVESLLANYARMPADFLDSPGPKLRLEAVDDANWPGALVGSKIGRYQIVRLIAAGGMGCVFEAHQEQPARSVALKIVRPGFGASSAWARFRLEPEILGRLQHPNIASVLEAGIHSGAAGGPLPYFAMELVPDAQTLAEFAATRQLSVNERLALFAKVCDAVHYGHQKAIIHRDLKPANILVGPDGEPKVIDFGVARATDSDVSLTTQHTHPGDLIGTLRYMSPEQVDGDPAKIDTRSDVYSLGVVLYELLSGMGPYPSTGTHFDVMKAIKETPPRPLSQVSRKLRGNVEAIVRKALEKDRRHRYQSVDSLVQDIRRHLRREPIAARPPTMLVKLLHWGVRHPIMSTAVASTLVSVAIVGATMSAIRTIRSKPARVWLSKDGTRAELQSATGEALCAWETQKIGGIRFGRLIREPAILGGRSLALLAFGEMIEHPKITGQLCAYDVFGNLAEPAWSRRVEDGEPVPRYDEDPQWTGSQFRIARAYVADIFPSIEGPEIVAIFQHSDYTRAIIRIYDINGRRRFEAWARLSPFDMYWNGDAEQLIITGQRGGKTLDELNFRERKIAGVHPAVVFALKPELDRAFYEDVDSAHGSSGPILCWYRSLEPVVDVGRLAGSAMCFAPRNSTAVVEINVQLEGLREHAGVGFDVDRNGSTILNSVTPNNIYEAELRRDPLLPGLERFRLGPFPPTP